MKIYIREIVIILIISLITCSPASSKDFSGKYKRVKASGKDWCGISISLTKIRYNRYRIDWELCNGEHISLELKGRIYRNMIDFRRESYGYTYTFTEKNKKLTVKLTVPGEIRVCIFERVD